MKNTITFTMTPAQFAADSAKAMAHGVAIAGPSGVVVVASAFGPVKLSYSYEEPTLTVTVLSHPWIEGEGAVESKIKEALG
jgi:hypothetical protein